MPGAGEQAVTVSTTAMSLDELVAVAHGARVTVDQGARERIRASRRVVDAALATGEPVYGTNTGVGHARDVRVSDETVLAMQPVLVMMHAGATGPPLPAASVRAAMAARLNGIARGGSGASEQVADMLAAMLNAGVHPVVPRDGSVGAGDLGQHALIAQVTLGAGEAELGGEILSGADALRAAGLAPLVLRPKDGLAIISANGFTLGEGALVLRRTGELLAAADTVTACSMDAAGANVSGLAPVVQAAKCSWGQVESAARIESCLVGGERVTTPATLQDALSFRVTAQVHGACRELLTFSASALVTELNAMTDNPLASIEAGRILGTGNFHPVLVALTFDALRPALAHVAQLSERRLGHLWHTAIETASTAPDVGGDGRAGYPWWVAGLQLRYAAAARWTRIRQLADPVTLDVPPLDHGHEDHATNAPQAVQRTTEALDVLTDVLAIELLVAWAVLVQQPGPAPAPATGRILEALDAALRTLPTGSAAHTVHERVSAVLPALTAASVVSP